MKDIKTFIIGFLSCACLFLLIGWNGNGSARYQGIAVEDEFVLLDTWVGAVYNLGETITGAYLWFSESSHRVETSFDLREFDIKFPDRD